MYLTMCMHTKVNKDNTVLPDEVEDGNRKGQKTTTYDYKNAHGVNSHRLLSREGTQIYDEAAHENVNQDSLRA